MIKFIIIKGNHNTYMSQEDMDIFQKRRINKISSLLKNK